MATPGEADIATVRRRTNEPSQVPYSDATLIKMIEAHPLEYDDEGAPTRWDIALTCSDVWSEKAAALAGNFDFAADGASYSRSQAYEQAKKQASYWASRAAARSVLV